ncbi:hypothetical protein F442_07375 [Phytophthora nicotianae P10297]|uniref:PH domain-containing protein n=1 Tax=Phytophthora nicotianae P10297 TaxID=1317064 RepID=W2ZJJ3_PHYNI|nr:hypothetical protein F442_07375 [Phytophthora nicotianae P10297]
MLVNGVDISMLEGWMIKINSNPSFFGKNMNRRWFKVGFVPGPGSEKKLVISYSTSKCVVIPITLFIPIKSPHIIPLLPHQTSELLKIRADGSTSKMSAASIAAGDFFLKEMIEIVSPSRTLRLKGETAVEHRLWSDSLYKLCNPSPKAAPTATIAEPRREHTSHTQRETKQDDDEEEDRAKCKHRSERDREHDQDHDRDRERDRDREHDQDYDRDRHQDVGRERDRDRHQDRDRERYRNRDRPRERVSSEERKRVSRSARSNRRDDSDSEDDNRCRDRSRGRSPRDDYDSRKRRSPSPTHRRSRREERELSRHSSRSSRHEREESSHSVSDIRPSEHDVSDDSQEEDEDSPRPSTNSSTRSVLVAQIKSGSGLEDGMAQCKNVMSDSEEEDVNYENKQADPPEESPREPLTSSTDPIDDDFSHEKLEQMIPQRMNLTEPTKHKNSEYFDSDEEEQEQPPSKTNTRLSDNKTPVSNVTADNNFVHDDWDAEEEPTSQPTTKAAYSTALTGGVAADANFVHDDWDD